MIASQGICSGCGKPYTKRNLQEEDRVDGKYHIIRFSHENTECVQEVKCREVPVHKSSFRTN